MVVVAPLPGGRHPIVATVDDAPEQPGVADEQQLLDARWPSAGATRIHEIVWSSRFRVRHPLADRYRAGQVLLAGNNTFDAHFPLREFNRQGNEPLKIAIADEK